MSTYNYNTLTRANDGNAFDFTTNSSVLYVDELPTGVTLQLRIDSQGNPPITLRPKTQLRFKQNDRLFFTPSAATAGTIRIFLFLDESNLLEFDQSQYSSESTITGTVDVNVVSPDPLPVSLPAGNLDVNIAATAVDPFNQNITQIGGSTANATSMGNTFSITNPDNTAVRGWTYLSTGSSTIFTATADTYITSCSLAVFGLTVTDNTIMLQHQNAASGIITALLVWVFNAANAGQNRGTFGLTHSFPIPYKLISGEKIVVLGGANSWSSGQIVGVST
jgi:hypothetical protein|tara:strand:+ start:4309 stop:5142 length:834 start_codon:yes stop_codon:yes gene_type:complete